MLSIGKLGDGGARYYTEGLGAVDEYYTEAGSRWGVWMGAGAEELGLAGEVDPGVFAAVLEGRDPASGARLGGTRSMSTVPGFDLCFRAPKSVSLLQALGDQATAATVLAAHRSAVGEALGYLDRVAVGVRRGHAGATVLGGVGLVGDGFEHFTSRAGDPHLHTHVVVANLTRGPDGRWSALDGRALYRHAKTAGYLYEAALRHELTRALGVAWGPVVNGIADLAGVPGPVVRAFSQRRAQIVAELARQGASSPRAAQVAALSTRPAKDRTADLEGLRAEWRERAASMGVEPDGWDGLVRAGRQPRPLDAGAAADRVLDPEGLTAHRSWFDRRDLLQCVAELAGDGSRVEEVEAVARAVLADERVVAVSGGRDGPRWSTAELLAKEQVLIADALARRGAGVGVVAERLVRTVQERYPTLSGEQAAMVGALTRSGDGVQLVVGVAGAGKTYALGAARDAWQAAGCRVVGSALSARAAQELSDGARIPSMTVARLLADLDRPVGGGLARGSVLVVDEAAMVGTRELAALAAHARHANAKLVLVGDDRQLPSISAGGAFAALADRLGAIELTENRRQRAGWERDTLADLRAGRAGTALAAYHAHGRHHHLGGEGLHERLVADWVSARQSGTRVMMLATRRDDVDRLNELARQHLREACQLGPDLLETSRRVFAVGDEVICGRNDRRLGVLNGTRASVVGVDVHGTGLTVRTCAGVDITLPAGYLDAGHVRHSYATTIYKAQGATTDRTFVLADEHLYQEAGYVALSRGRDRNDLYTPAPAFGDHEGHGRPEPARGDSSLRPLGRSRAQQAASSVTELPGRTLADLDRERRHLDRQLGDADYRASRQRARQLEAMIKQRTEALGLWAVDHPTAEHLDFLGSAPRQPQRRAEWVLAAGEISAYYERHGIAYDPNVIPERGEMRVDHSRTAWTIREASPALDRSRPLEPDRRLDLGLGL